MTNTKSIGIVGCGWLGKPLSKALSNNFKVECFNREKTSDNSSFWQSDTIVIAISTKDNYLQTLQKIAKLSSASSNILLMSSISVYREFDTKVDESVSITKIGLQKQAEDLMLNLRKNVVILRLGGLMGDDRISGKWKKVSTFSDGEVNYIHSDDAINITKKIIENEIVNGIFNLVAPQHPLRSQVHKRNSEKFGFELGNFEGRTKRIVYSDAIVKKLNYTFVHPDPLEFWD
jgi:nucleoside-diphosphate-sugar epimerase